MIMFVSGSQLSTHIQNTGPYICDAQETLMHGSGHT